MLLQIARSLLGGFGRQVSPQQVRDAITAGDLRVAKRLVRRLHSAVEHRDLHRQCFEAEIAFKEQRDAEARQLFTAVLDGAPGWPDAHYGLSLILSETGEHERALEHALFAKNQRPAEPRFNAQLGYCYTLAGYYPAAEAPLRAAVRLNPRDKYSWNNLGMVLGHREHLAEAKACFLQALDLDSHFERARENLSILDQQIAAAGWQAEVIDRRTAAGKEAGLLGQESSAPARWREVETLLESGRGNEALSLAEELAAAAPGESDAAVALAQTYMRTADYESAAGVLEASLDESPENPKLHLSLAKLLLTLERSAPALVHLERAVELGLGGAEVQSLLALALHNVERYQEAVDVLEQLYAEQPTSTLGKQYAASLLMACRYEQAIFIYERLFAEGVPRGELIGNFACALAYAGRLAEAQRCLDESLTDHAFDPGLRMMRGIIHLLHERFAEGWDDYEWRNFSNSRNLRVLPFPKWRGEPLAGKSIVVLAEQGLGDQVMFASCIEDLVAMQARLITVEAMDRVAATLERSLPSCKVIATRQKKDMAWAAEVDADYYVPLADLPRVFRRSRDAFPRRPYLVADENKRAYWRAKLAESGPRPWVGVSWKGGTEITRTVIRTVDVTSFVRLADGLPGTWISLQYGPTEMARAEAREQGREFLHWQEAIDDLDEFAALISELDLVVTVCNTTVHYAGAMGRPTIVLAPKVPEWRYGIKYDRMPWYADVQVMRQEVAGEWGELFRRAREEVERRLPDYSRQRT